MEHTLANIQTLAFLARGGRRGYLVGPDSVATALAGGEIAFGAERGGYVSVLALSDRATVDIEGLKYELRGGRLTNDFPVGASNEFAGRPALIRATSGEVAVIFPRRCLRL